MMTTMTDDPLLTVQEVAQQLRLNPATVRLWLKRGVLRGHLLSSDRAGWRIPASEVRRVLAEGSERAKEEQQP
jgi:excisionase family DNA binding protein